MAWSNVAVAGGSEAQSSGVPRLLALRDVDEAVLTAGHRLAVRGLDLCPDRQWQHGLAVHDLSQYPRRGRGEAIAAFGLDRGPAVLALARGGPAQSAGLRRDDVLLAADGQALPRPSEEVENSFAPTERILDALDAAFADGSARLTVSRAGVPLEIAVTAQPGCATRFQVIPAARLNAKADGRYVQVTSAIAQAAGDEHELAAMIAHELAHNILRHRARLAAAGVDRGPLEGFGRNGRLIRATEIEADRFTVYLLDRAGYDIEGMVRWWRRLGPRTASIFASGTHPHWRLRVTMAEAEVAAIRAARRAGRRAQPPVGPPPSP